MLEVRCSGSHVPRSSCHSLDNHFYVLYVVIMKLSDFLKDLKDDHYLFLRTY